MPFGRHKGIPLSALPLNYLLWLESRENLYDRLREAVDEELDRRAEGIERTAVAKAFTIVVEPAMAPMVRRIIEAGYKGVARQLHPDCGGDADQMVRLNALVESMRAQFATLEACR